MNFHDRFFEKYSYIRFYKNPYKGRRVSPRRLTDRKTAMAKLRVAFRSSANASENSTFCPTHSVFMCFVWIWEQTAVISLYSNNWLVCVTEMECVYCTVRTGSLYIILRSAHTDCIYVFCVDLRKTAIISLYSINWLTLITEKESAYCAVRVEPLYTVQVKLGFKILCRGSSCLSSASNHRKSSSNPGNSLWGFW